MDAGLTTRSPIIVKTFKIGKVVEVWLALVKVVCQLSVLVGL